MDNKDSLTDEKKSLTLVDKIKKWASNNPIIALLIILTPILSLALGLYLDIFKVFEIKKDVCKELKNEYQKNIEEIKSKASEKLSYYIMFDLSVLLKKITEVSENISNEGCEMVNGKITEIENEILVKIHYHLSLLNSEKDYSIQILHLCDLLTEFVKENDKSNFELLDTIQKIKTDI